MSLSDDFNRANQDPIAGNWSKPSAFGALKIDTNQIAVSSPGSDSLAYWSANTWNADHTSQVTVAVEGGGDGGPAVRISAVDDAYINVQPGTDLRMYAIVDGGFAEIDNDAGEYAPGTLAKMLAVGTTISSQLNAVGINSVTNSANAGGSAGIFMYDGVIRFDDWVGTGEVAGAAPGIEPYLRYRSTQRAVSRAATF